MTETIGLAQVGTLLGLAAARDQRTVGDADILAWHADLNAAGTTFADAETALTRFYVDMANVERKYRYRATSTDIITLVRKIQAERVEHFAYLPSDREETGREYLNNLRQQLAAVKAGQWVPQEPMVLTGGPHPDVLPALAGATRDVPDDDGDQERRAAPRIPRAHAGTYGVECPNPACRALIGRKCKSPSGKPRTEAHDVRVRLARGESIPDPEQQAAEIERRRLASQHFAGIETAESGRGRHLADVTQAREAS